jgi:hypothetical protein
MIEDFGISTLTIYNEVFIKEIKNPITNFLELMLNLREKYLKKVNFLTLIRY